MLDVFGKEMISETKGLISFPDRLELLITQVHIDGGTCGDSRLCAVSQAAVEFFGGGVSARTTKFPAELAVGSPTLGFARYDVDFKALDFICMFDVGEDVKPTKLEFERLTS